MTFAETPIAGAWLIESRRIRIRGACSREPWPTTNSRRDRPQRLLRAAEHLVEPAARHAAGPALSRRRLCEEKLVRVTRGAIFDVIVDLRRGSATLRLLVRRRSSADNRRQLYIPKGSPTASRPRCRKRRSSNQMTTRFQPEAARGIRWNDETLAIAWPLPQSVVISEKDRRLPSLVEFSDVRP